MNAADQRRLTPWLAILCVLLTLLLLALLTGWGRGVHWAGAGAARSLPQAGDSGASTGSMPPLQHYAEIWQRPLFTTNRRPAPEAAGDGDAEVSLGDLELTGIILAPGLHMALLRDRSDGHEVRVREGAQLATGGWTLQSLKPRSAVFVGNGKRTELPLKVAAQIDGGNMDAHAAADAGSPSVPMIRRAGTPPLPRVPALHHGTPHLHGTPFTPAQSAASARIKALKARIKQRRRQQSAHAGEH